MSSVGSFDFFLEGGRWKHTIDDLGDSVAPFSNILLEGQQHTFIDELIERRINLFDMNRLARMA
ncbi:MAG: hypothetical protein A4S17_13725 [Proteobacteria bacterium HN_bin10]|nr:MAG: hypothetical protein A4S17_13725 [Proteobacteria bacterium HN_bin10]